MSIPEIDPIAAETRRAKRERVLGEDAACVMCGLGTIESLIAVDRNVLEAHHIVGRANDGDLTVPMCRNCHAEITERYRDAGVPLNRPPTLLHRLAAMLRAFGAMLIAIGQTCAGLAEKLIRLMTRLDNELPGWRTFEEAAS
jgi:hypothetical protein